MKICIIGKYPPIEGGVSARTYWLAHDLARSGHQILVVTNANETEAPYRINMAAEDWQECEKTYESGGSVTVYWTNNELEKQYHIPWHNPFVTKLTSKALIVNQEHDIDLFFSYYLEPYAIAGYLASQISRKPHVIKHAGSDFGRLYRQEDFKEIYRHILQQANAVITGKPLVERFVAEGIAEAKLAIGFPSKLPDCFNTNPDTHLFKWHPDPETKIIGIYGKIGKHKGSFDLLHVLKNLIQAHHKIHLVAVGHGEAQEQQEFDALVAALKIQDHITQLPYLPNWKIPTFIKSCHAVCFLEQNFAIDFHTPTVALEVLACGIPLICSVEILQKQPQRHQLIHSYNCIAVNDVTNHHELAEKIKLILIANKEELAYLGSNGNRYYQSINKLINYPNNYLSLFEQIAANRNFNNNSNKTVSDKVDNKLIWTNLILKQHASNHAKLQNLNHCLALLENFAAKTINYTIYRDLISFEHQLITGLTSEIIAEKQFAALLFRGYSIIRILEKMALENLTFTINVPYSSRLYHYNVLSLLKMRQDNKLPRRVSSQLNYIIIFKAPNTNSIKLLSLNFGEYRLIDAIANNKNIISIDKHKKLLINLLRLGFLSINKS